MPRNRSVVRHQILFSGPTGEICPEPPISPIFLPFFSPSAPRLAFFLTRCSDSDILNRLGCDMAVQVGNAKSVVARTVPHVWFWFWFWFLFRSLR